MLFSYNWLKEYVKDLPSANDAARALTMSGTEVESITPSGCAVKGVVTAEVLSCAKHPNADKLQLCEVSTGGAAHSIVCGAKNMKPGDRVALALPGAELPGGLKIKKSKIRGVESGGMMCSEKELGLKEVSEGIMILPPSTPLGVDLESALGQADYMLEVSITPNRADLLSIRGLARELSTIFALPFTDNAFAPLETGNAVAGSVSVTIDAGAPCARYCARVIEGVKIGPSSAAVAKRLESHGIRPINNVVDVTNYVLLATGQPLHAFDLSKISGRKIIVRQAREGESIETIDNKKRALDSSMLVIADESGPAAVAGVMGGKASEVDNATASVLLESAWFEPASIRRTSKKLGLSTDSSYRFERGVDIGAVTSALDMATAMIKGFAGDCAASRTVDVYPSPLKTEAVKFRIKKAEDTLGTKCDSATVVAVFERLGMRVEKKGDVLLVTPPSYRMDIRLEAELIEEAARIIGYDNIPAVLPSAPMREAAMPVSRIVKRRVSEVLTSAGFFEAVNYSFVSPEAFALARGEGNAGVTVLNPLTVEQSVMRGSLLPSLLSNLRYNIFQKNDDVRLFEIGPAFFPDDKGKLPCEKWKVSGVMHGLRRGNAWNAEKAHVDFYDVKGVVEALLAACGVSKSALSFSSEIDELGARVLHPGKAAVVFVNGNTAGILGEVHPDVKEKFELKAPAMLFELDLDALYGGYSANVIRYAPVPRFPESARDIAFIVSEQMQYGEMLSAIERLDTKLVERVELFDVYCGSPVPKGKKSMAIRITYRSAERTLRQEEVDELNSKVAGVLATGFGAQIRIG